jgi:hypothetical protein
VIVEVKMKDVEWFLRDKIGYERIDILYFYLFDLLKMLK